MKKRLLSAFMALALCLTLLPAPAWAAEADAPEGGTIVQEEQQEKAPAAESPAILEQAAENGIAAQNGGDSTVENAVAEVTTDGATTQYADLSAALAKVSTDGGTVKLLNNVTASDPLSIVNANDLAITLDLNGHTLSGPGDSVSHTFLQVLGNVTICDSSDAKSGIIGSSNSSDVCVSSGTLTITGGTFDCLVVVGNGGNMKISGGIFAALETRNNTAIRTLLADGYGLKRSDGRWLTEDELTRTTAAKVTAEAAPLTSVAISVTPGTTVEYGQSVKLNLEYTTNPTGISVKHKWYSVDETDIATEIPDANDTEYTPTNLSVGEHKYRVTATADGYSKSADITITVEKIDLANATVTIDPWHADGKFRFYPYASETAALSFLSVVTVTANGEKYPLNSDDYTYEGATATRVGKYTLTITAKDSCVNYKGSKTFDWEVIPHQLYRPTFQGSQTYTKPTTAPPPCRDRIHGLPTSPARRALIRTLR